MSNLLSIPEMTSAQISKYSVFNQALTILTALMTGARDIITAYPGSPVEGAAYIVGTAFGTHEANDIVIYIGGAWYEMDPVEGLSLWVWDENVRYTYTGTVWDAEPQYGVASASLSPSSSRSPSASLSPSASISPSSSASPSA